MSIPNETSLKFDEAHYNIVAKSLKSILLEHNNFKEKIKD